MKEHRSNKFYNSQLTRWVDRLLPFVFNIEHIPGAKIGLVDYISRQPNQEAKVTNKYDEKFAVATITRICDAIAAIYVNTTNKTANHSTLTASITHIPHVPRILAQQTILICFMPLIETQLSCFSKILKTQLKSSLIQFLTQTHVKSTPIQNLTQIPHISIQFLLKV